MIWALLALLGIPIWFIASILVVVFRNRKKVRSSPDVFEFVGPTDKGWSRRPSYGRWVSDVLIVHMGIALVRTDARQIAAVDCSAQLADPPKRINDGGVEMVLSVSGGDDIRIAVSAAGAEKAAGPFSVTR